MAANDGSLVFDTELDNSGFEKGSDKLLAAVKDLTNAVDNLGDNMMKSFSRITPMLQSIATSASNVSERITQTASQAADANERIIKTEEDAAAAAQKVVKANEDIALTEQTVANTAQQTAQAINNQNAEMVNFSAKTANASANISSLEHEINSISSGMRSISSLAENGFSNGKSVLAFDDKLTEMQHRLDGAREKLEAFGATKIPTDDYIWVTEAIQRTEAECDKLLDKQAKLKTIGVSENSQRWKSLEYEIQLANEKLTTYKNDLQGLIYLGKDFTLGANTDVFKQMQAAVNETKTELDRNKAVINAEAIAQARLNVQAAQERVIRAQNASERAAALEQMKAAQNELNRIAESVANNSEKQKPPEVATTGWLKFATALRKAGSAAMKTAATLAKMTFRGMANGLKAVTSKLKSFTKTSKQSTLSAHSLTKALTSIKTILVSRIKSMLISSITNAVKDGIHALAQYSKEFDNAMSNMRNRTKEIGANISVTIGNLIKSLEPLITQLLQGLSTAITYINAFMAVLSGSNTVTVAKKQTESYAASLKDATNNAKALKAEVYGFDELNKRSSADIEKANEQADLFEEVPVTSILPEQVQDVFDKVKQAAENQDWQGIGKVLADGLNSVFSKIDDWINNVLRPAGVKWARRIAEILNGLTYGFDWGKAGKAVADGINAVFDIADTFLKTYDFEGLGRGIGTTIQSWFENIEWELIGQTFADSWNALIDLIYGIVSSIKGETIGSSLAQFVNSFTNGLKLDKAAETVGKGLNLIVKTIKTFISKTDWKAIATKIASSINTLFSTINWAELGATLIEGFNTAVNFLSSTISSINWGAIGSSVAEFLKSAIVGDDEGNGGISWADIGKLIHDCIDGAILLCANLLTETDFAELVSSLLNGLGEAISNADIGDLASHFVGFLASVITNAIGGAFELILSGVGQNFKVWQETFSNLGNDAAAGFMKGCSDQIDGFKEAFHAELNKIVGWIKSFWGIHSPSVVWAELGKYCIEGLFNGISGAWDKIIQYFNTNLKSLTDGFSGAWNTVVSTFNSAKDNVTTIIASIGQNLTTGWNEISKNIGNVWNTIKTNVTTRFNETKDAIGTTLNTVKQNFSTGWESIKKTAETTWNTVKTVIGDKFTQLKENLGNTINSLKSNLSTGWENIKTVAAQKWQELKSNTETAYNNLKSNLQNNDFSSVGNNLVEGLKQGISNAWSGLSSFVGNLASGLTNTLNGVLGIHSPSKVWAETGMYLDEGLLNGLKNGEKNILSMVSGLAKDVGSEIGSEKATLNFNIASNGVLEQITAIADRLSDIALQFRAINTFLTDAGNFNVPIIASGTEIPYKTRIAADTPGTGGGSFADDLDERLSDQTYILRQILNLIQRFKNVDGDALLRAIEALRMADRSYGV